MTKRIFSGQLLGQVVAAASPDVVTRDKLETPAAARGAVPARASHGFAAVQRANVKRVQTFANRRRGK